MNWHELSLFLAAYRAGSITAAAQRLGLGQATLSRRLAHLESSLGHLLFDRNRSGLVPTEAALLLLPHAEAMAKSAHGALTSLNSLEQAPEGVVRIAMPPAAGFDLLPPVLPLLKARHPGLQIELLAGTPFLDLAQREADIAIRTRRPEASNLFVRRFFTSQLIACASPSYIATLSPNAAPQDIEWIGAAQHLQHLDMAQLVQQFLNGRPPVMLSDSILAMRQAARFGLGAMILPELQAKLAGLQPLPIPLPPMPEIPIFLVGHKALRQVPRVRTVIDFLLELIDAMGDSKQWPPAGYEPETIAT